MLSQYQLSNLWEILFEKKIPLGMTNENYGKRYIMIMPYEIRPTI